MMVPTSSTVIVELLTFTPVCCTEYAGSPASVAVVL
jgi:hypothetical protein